MVYECKRCGYNANKISHLKAHLNRKKECNDILKCNHTSMELLKELDEYKLDYEYICDNCDLRFMTTQGKNKHAKKCTREKMLIEENKQLRMQLETINAKINIILKIIILK
jgi:hypothetical protein